MITLTCTNCRAALQIDDAFAGSTCRCQFCGTIQTVPGKRRAAAPGSTEPKALYARGARGAAEGSGLDALAEVVASSGLHHQAARAKAAPAAAPPARDNRALLVILGAAGMLVIVLGIIVIVLLSRSSQPTAMTPGSVPQASAPAPVPAPTAAKPVFLDIELNDPSIIYILDRGSAMRESLGSAVAATIGSIRSLGTDRRFQVLFWDNGQEAIATPAAPAYATRDAVATAQRTIENVVAFGQSDATAPFRRAVAARPASIVLVTAKGFDLDEGFLTSLLTIRGESGIRIHCISIGGVGSGETLERLAKSTGGQFRAVSTAELQAFADR